MCDNLFFKILWVVVYAITAYFTFTGNMMMAMYWMAGGMLAQAVVDLVYHFWPNRKKVLKKAASIKRSCFLFVIFF